MMHRKHIALIVLAVIAAIILVMIMIPLFSRRLEGSPDCGRLYFRVLNTVSDESSQNTPDVTVNVYGMEINDRGDTVYNQVQPYHLGGGWFIVDNCSIRKQIEIARNDTGMQVIIVNDNWRQASTVVLDSIGLRYGNYRIHFDEHAPLFTGTIPGQVCSGCLDITPANWDAVRIDRRPAISSIR